MKLASQYRLALDEYESRKSRSTLESVFHKGTLMSDKYEELESLSERDYEELKQIMRGFDVNREEIVFVEPDTRFFLRLATRFGSAADRSFFRLLVEIKPNNVWASYFEQQTDYSGCTIYGNGKLTSLYGKATSFMHEYPKAYSNFIVAEIDGILENFDENICSCGGRSQVIREFSLFVRTFPNDSNTPKIRNVLTKLRGRKDFRFNCKSG